MGDLRKMRFRKLANITLAAAIAVAPAAFTPALAATAAEARPGMAVVDPNGGTVGTVTAVSADTLLLKTNRHEVSIPLTSFTAHEGKLLFAMTADQLNAATEESLAEAAAAVAPGAQVYGSDGTLAGTIESIDTELVTIKLASGNMVRLPRTGVGGSDRGAVLGMTTANLTELAAGAQ
jgi:preprotein translocase subunit YajC